MSALERLRQFNEQVRRHDPELTQVSDFGNLEISELVSPEGPASDIALESIIMRTQRPVLAIFEDKPVVKFDTPEDTLIWKPRIEAAGLTVENAIPAVGRIELTGSAYDWVGTGWLISESVMVTNRHVADAFAERKGQGFIFKMGDQARVSAAVDFLQEIGNTAQLIFKLKRPLFIEQTPGPDVAFFEVDVSSGNSALAKPISLARGVRPTKNAAVIGYPAFDSRIPDVALMEQIYGKVYNKKRLAPGAVTSVETTRLLHDCTTLGGNSGSVVLDLDSGAALGLHFSGSFLTTNFAVRADIVARLFERVRSGRVRPEVRRPGANAAVPPPPTSAAVLTGQSVSLTIPLTITMTLGNVGAAQVSPQIVPSFAPADDGSDTNLGEEGRVEDYIDREGYLEDFLGEPVPLPEVVAGAPDVLSYQNGDQQDTVLRYEHFSVVMSKARRMCIFSAVNIDGGLSKKSARVAWKWDPRIPQTRQIMNECYGSPPKFSRGHMTRREDPSWGDARTSQRGNQDSMHVTNATPQMQAFNSPIWLALEDYALEHARSDEMKISVFTGPYFAPDDPVMYGVKIPQSFWKIIAFIHDETGQLCATGYEMSQVDSLQPQEEFIFGAFQSRHLGMATQVAISTIERKAGLSFGLLAAIDPMAAEQEAVSSAGHKAPLLALEQIRFVL